MKKIQMQRRVSTMDWWWMCRLSSSPQRTSHLTNQQNDINENILSYTQTRWKAFVSLAKWNRTVCIVRKFPKAVSNKQCSFTTFMFFRRSEFGVKNKNLAPVYLCKQFQYFSNCAILCKSDHFNSSLLFISISITVLLFFKLNVLKF